MKPKEPPEAILVSLVVGAILALAAKRLSKPDPITPFRDSKPTTLTTRGTPLDYVIGRHRPNVVFAWAGKRTTMGGATYEEGVHWLHAGRVRAFHKIIEDGKVLYDFGPGGVPALLASGVERPPLTFSASNGQTFTLLFGHPDPAPDAVYSSLADPERLDVASRWPDTVGVWWHSKRLNEIERWPLIEYEISTQPEGGYLTRTEPWIGSSRDLDPAVSPQNLVGFSKVGLKWRARISGDWTVEFQRGKWCRIDFFNDPEESGKFEIDSSSFFSALGIQYSSPDATISNTGAPNWSVVGAGTAHQAIDDPSASPTDSDYVSSSNAAAVLVVGLENVTDPNNPDRHSFRVRYRFANPTLASHTLTFRVELLEDPSGSPTVIYSYEKQESISGSAFTTWTTIEVAIPVISAIGIGDYSDLGARFTFVGQAGSTELHVSLFELVVEDPGRTEFFLHERHQFPTLISPVGETQPYLDGMDGVNPAHAVAELLFNPSPRGRAIPTSLFDLETFEVVGEQLELEHVPINGRWQDAPTAATILAAIMQDVGMVFRPDPTTGLHGLQLLRDFDPVIDVPAELLLGPVAERTKLLGPKRANRLTYAFDDRERNYKRSTYVVNDDGQASLTGDRRDQPVEIKTLAHYALAKTAAERRALENEVGENATVVVHLQGSLRDLCSGLRIRLPGETEILRVDAVKPIPYSPGVEIDCLPDLYGVEQVNEEAQQGTVLAATASSGSGPPVAELNAAEALLELPDALAPSEGAQAVALLQIRASRSISAAELQLSLDGGTTYSSAAMVSSFAAGGTLDADLDPGDPFVEYGPTLTLLGPDAIDLVQDLRGDEASWRGGAQLLIIGGEVCYLESVEWIDAATVRLGRVIRARAGTRQEAHAQGSAAFILPMASLVALEPAGLEPGLDLRWRTVPRAGALQADPETATVRAQVLEGRGVVPPAPENLSTATGVPAYRTGEDIELSWSFRRGEGRRVGAGRLGYGTRTGKVRPRGAFGVIVSDLSTGKEARLEGVLTNAMTLTNATILEHFGGEPSTLRFEVVHIVDGFSSPAALLEVVRL